MAGRSRVLNIQIVGDSKKFENALGVADKRAKTSERTLDSLGKRGALSLGKLAKAAGAAAVAYVGMAEAKQAVNVTTDLAKATIGLNKNLGLSVQRASEWAAVAKVRGVETKALNQAFGTLAKNADKGAQGTDAQVAAFKRLGITQGELKKLNFNQLLGEAADGLKNMEPGAKKTATAMQLFGRGWQTIVPVLRDGSKGMQEQLDLANKYGATFGGKTLKSQKDLIAAQREAKFATLGLQVAFSTQLAPSLTKVITGVAHFVKNMRDGKGFAGALADAISEVVTSFHHFFQWVGNAIHNMDRFGDGARHVIFAIGRWFSDTFNDIKRIFGNAMAFILRKFADLFDVASHLPGIGGKFGDLRDKANAAADKIDRAGEKTQSLIDKLKRLKPKDIQVRVNLAFNDPTIPRLQPFGTPLTPGKQPHGGPSLKDMIQAGSQRKAQQFVNANMDKFAPLLTGPGNAPGKLGLLEALGHRMGLVTTSGYRPGDPGFHGLNRARDLSGAAGTMMAYAKMLYQRFGTTINELIYTPLGVGIDAHRAGPLTSLYPASTLADHYDHVHVALQRGGMIRGHGTGDKVPVLAEPGEGFINKRAVQALGGSAAIAAINKLIPRFQSGGTVPLEYRRLIGIAQKRYGIPGNILAGLIQVESGWNPNAVSPAGAFGLTQFMPGTAAGYGVARGSGHHAVASQILGAAKYLIALGFKGDMRGALAKYNGGPGNPQYGYADTVIAASRQYAGDLPLEDTTNRHIPTRAERRERARRLRERTPTHGRTGLSLEESGSLADRLVNQAESTKGTADDRNAALFQLGVLVTKQKRLKARLHKINHALKGKLRPATRQRLLTERAGILSELSSIPGEASGSLQTLVDIGAGQWARPFARAFGVGVPTATDTGDTGDTGGGPAEPDTSAADAQRELAEAVKALKESIDRQSAFAQSVAGIGQATALKAFADVVSGQIGGSAGQRGRSAGDGVTGARYRRITSRRQVIWAEGLDDLTVGR